MILHRRLALNSILISVFTGLGAVMGFGVDIIIATRFGLSQATDAYITAITIPVVIATAVFTASQNVIIVSLTRHFSIFDQLESDQKPSDLYSTLITLSIGIGLFVALVGSLGSGVFMRLIAPGLSKLTMTYTVGLSRILFFRIPAALTIVVMRSALYAKRHYLSSSASNLIPSLVAFVLLLIYPQSEINWAAWSLTIGSWIGLIWVLGVSVYHRIGKYHFSMNLQDPELHNLGRDLSAPLAGLLFRQGITVAERWFGSYLGSGIVATLGYVNKIISVLAGIIIASINTAGLPPLAMAIAKKQLRLIKRRWYQLLSLSSLATLTIGIGLIIFSQKFVDLLFVQSPRGMETADAFQMARVLSIYAFGLILLGPFRAQQSYFFAAKKANWVAILLSISTLITLILDWPLVRSMGAQGLGLSFSTGILVALITGFLLSRRLSKQMI